MLEKQAGDGQIALLQDVLFGVLSTLKGVEQGLAFSLRSLMPFNHQVPAAAAKSRQSCPTLCDPIDGGPPGFCPWDSPGKNNGVGCHFLLQCMKVESESEVAQSCLILRDPMDRSPSGSSIHGIFQARVLEWGAIAFSGCCLLRCFKGLAGDWSPERC